MFKIKESEIFSESRLPEITDEFVLGKCGNPKARASRSDAYSNSYVRANKSPDSEWECDEVFSYLYEMYEEDGSMGKVQKLLNFYGKGHLVVKFIGWVLRKKFSG